MTLRLTITDNQDGTGATATVTGSDAGSANVVYASAVSDGPNVIPWAAAGSRTGDGTVLLPLSPAYYYGYAAGLVSGAPALSIPVRFPVSLSADSLYNRILLAIQAKIQGLSFVGPAPSLTTLAPGQVVVQPKINPKVLSYPCLVVSPPDGWPERVKPLVNSRDDIGYPVVCTIIDRQSPDYTPPYPTYYLWRERLFRGVRYQRLAGVAECETVEPAPRPMVAWSGKAFEQFTTAVGFIVWCRETRGI
jgi:hypothetical protein